MLAHVFGKGWDENEEKSELYSRHIHHAALIEIPVARSLRISAKDHDYIILDIRH